MFLCVPVLGVPIPSPRAGILHEASVLNTAAVLYSFSQSEHSAQADQKLETSKALTAFFPFSFHLVAHLSLL